MEFHWHGVDKIQTIKNQLKIEWLARTHAGMSRPLPCTKCTIPFIFIVFSFVISTQISISLHENAHHFTIIVVVYTESMAIAMGCASVLRTTYRPQQ